MKDIEHIREEEKKYHEDLYDNFKLFEAGSWLHKPVKVVMDSLGYFEGNRHVKVLDLGCGVGRNSIPMAALIKGNQGEVICVDLLESALTKLMTYSKEYGVDKYLKPVRCDIGKYVIAANQFDLIVAVSSLEHVKSLEILNKVLKDMAAGAKAGGIICIILNTNIKETVILTNENLEVSFEINASTAQCWEWLQSIYCAWEPITAHAKPLELEINRDGKAVLLSSDCITFVAKKIDRVRHKS